MAGPQFISPERRSQLSHVDPRWRLKFGLQLTTILLALTSVVLFAAAIPQWNANFFHNKGPMRGDWTDAMSIGPLTFTILFSVVSIVYLFLWKAPIPPKVCVVIFALILLTLGPSIFLAGHGSLFRHWRASAVRNQNGGLVCNMLNIFSRECEPILYSIGELQIGGVVLGSLVWIMVFMLLLISIYDTRAAKMQRPRLPRRLTLMIGDMEKGYRRNRDFEQGRSNRLSRNSRRHYGTKQHYRAAKRAGDNETIPIVYVQEPPATHPPRSS